MSHLRFGVLAVLVVCGCGERPTQSSRQIGDTTFVYSPEPVRGTASLREILRIGVMDGAPEYMFARITEIAVGPERDVFVAELNGDVRQYDADGTFVQTVARVGQGPGEVAYVVAMDVAVDGRLALVDFGNQRISIYSPDGAFIRQIRRPLGRPGYGRGAIHWDDDGELWLAINPPRTGPDTLMAQPRPLFGRLVGDGQVVDTVLLPTRAWDGCERRRPGHAGGFMEDRRLPFMPFAQWSRNAAGVLASGCGASYSIDVLAPVSKFVVDWPSSN